MRAVSILRKACNGLHALRRKSDLRVHAFKVTCSDLPRVPRRGVLGPRNNGNVV